MNILIIVPRSLLSGDHVDYQYLFPLGLGYISSALKSAGHAVACLNLNHYPGTIEKLIHARLRAGVPYDLVCTGGLSIAYLHIKRIVEAVKASGTKPKIVIGGGLVSSEPELMFNALNPDYVVLGEGEETIRELAACLEQQKDLAGVAGLGYRQAGGGFVMTTPRNPIMDIDALPWPDFTGFEYETYLNNLKPTDQYLYDLFDHPRAYPILTSRSCPYVCTFCYHPIGNKYRQRSMDSIMGELEVMIPRYRINVIVIFDELFSHNTQRVHEFCERLTQIVKNVSWEVKWSCQMRVDRLDGDMLAAMRKSGCYLVSYGFESYSPEVLRSMKKHITPAQIDRAVNLTMEHKLSIQANFIFGDCAETLQTMRQTLEYWKTIAYAGILLDYIKVYPGTELYVHCLEKGIIKDRLDFIENHIFEVLNMTDAMTDREFVQSQIEVALFQLRHYIIAVPSRVSRDATGAYAVTVTCPHCAQEVQYGNFALPHAAFFNIMTYCRHCRRRFFMMAKASRFMIHASRVFFAVIPMGLKIQLFKLWQPIRSRLIKTLITGHGQMAKLTKLFYH